MSEDKQEVQGEENISEDTEVKAGEDADINVSEDMKVNVSEEADTKAGEEAAQKKSSDTVSEEGVEPPPKKKSKINKLSLVEMDKKIEELEKADQGRSKYYKGLLSRKKELQSE